MRNAVQRRNHKERAQPFERKKWGLLEKHKDYVLRAKDFNTKKRRLKTLRAKGAERNPDEFYFAMTSSTTVKGVHVASRGNTSLSQDAVRLLKTQDAGYLRVATAVERNKRQKLERELHFLEEEEEDEENDDEEMGFGGKKKKRHVVFVDNEKDVAEFRPHEYFDTPKELLGRTFNRPRMSQLAALPLKTEEAETADNAQQSSVRKGRERKYKELEARMKREEELNVVERELDEQRDKMGKGGSVRGVTKTGKKWIVRGRKK